MAGKSAGIERVKIRPVLNGRAWFRLISWLPAALTVAADVYMGRSLLSPGHPQDPWTVWRLWLTVFLLACGCALPRLWARLTAVFLLMSLIFLCGYSVGFFYVPALAAGVLAALLQMDREEPHPRQRTPAQDPL